VPSPLKALELLVGAALGRLIIGGVTGDTPVGALDPLVDWRWLFAVPLGMLLALMVELVVNPDAFE